MTKKIVVLLLMLVVIFTFTGCVFNSVNTVNRSDQIVNTYEVTDEAVVKEYFEQGKFVTLIKYYELGDGTFKTDSNSYKYRLEITGRMNAAAKDSTFVYLSNIEDISFDQAWKASGLSSNMDDYFDPKDAVLVAMK